MNFETEEAPFQYDELFYSKTDKRGVILSGNSVFQRVSGYNWDELVNKPHNIIRHPDMPRGVFHLLWDYLKKDQPIGAFVKNRSKDGRHYWVFALALPVEDGYISLRMKPGGDLLQIVAQQYSELRDDERSEKISPEESQKRLLARLRSLGFDNYDAFMSTALAHQIDYRSSQLNRPTPQVIKVITDLSQSNNTVTKETDKVLGAFKNSHYLPLNLEIQASKSGQMGSQISVVASRYQIMMTEMNSEIGKFSSMAQRVSERTNQGRFLVGAFELLNEVRTYLSAEAATSEADRGLAQIDQLAGSYLHSSVSGLREVADLIRDFIAICTSMESFGAGLEVVRVTGKIESSHLDNRSGVDTVLNDLKGFQVILTGGIKEILERNASMSHAAALLSQKLKSLESKH